MNQEFLRELCEAPAVASNEGRVRDVLRKYSALSPRSLSTTAWEA